MRYLFIYTTVTILLLTACGPAVSSETAPTPPTAAPTTNPAQATPDSPPAGTTPLPPALTGSKDADKGEAVMGDAVIVYQRSGGFAGVQEQWAIYPDGQIVASDGRQWQVPSEQVEQLLAEIETLGFFEMDGSYMPLDTCCDRFTYVIMVRHHDDTVKTVTTIDASPDTPPELWRVIDEMSSLVTIPERD